MSRTQLLLQKKLQLLQSQFTHLANHPPEPSSQNPTTDQFRHRLVFLRNLLTAELAVHPSQPTHLVQIKQQLANLEAAFHCHCTHTNTNRLDDHNVCLCTESGLDDGGGGIESMEDEDALGSYELPEKIAEAVVRPTDRRENDVGGGSRGAWQMWEFRVLAMLMTLGAILMVKF